MGKAVTHLDKFSAYCAKRKAYDIVHAASAKAWKELNDAERELIDSMNDEGVAGFEVKAEEKLKVSLRRNFSIAVNKDNEYLIRDWLTETEGDVQLFTKEELNKSAISELIRQKIDAGKLEEDAVPPFFKLKTTPSLVVRGWDKANDNKEDIPF
jgi:hypothetical protein